MSRGIKKRKSPDIAGIKPSRCFWFQKVLALDGLRMILMNQVYKCGC